MKTSLVIKKKSRLSRAGQALVEYALVLTFISVMSIVVLTMLGEQVRSLFSTIINAFSAVRDVI